MKSSISSNHWILIFLILLVGSSYPYKSTKEKLDTASRSLATANKNLIDAKTKKQKLTEALAKIQIASPKSITPASDVFSELGYSIRLIPKVYGVEITSFRVGGSNQGPGEISNLGRTFAEAKTLKAINVVVEGKYTSYEKLKQFVSWFQQQPVSIGEVKVKDNTFNLSLDIYGS